MNIRTADLTDIEMLVLRHLRIFGSTTARATKKRSMASPYAYHYQKMSENAKFY